MESHAVETGGEVVAPFCEKSRTKIRQLQTKQTLQKSHKKHKQPQPQQNAVKHWCWPTLDLIRNMLGKGISSRCSFRDTTTPCSNFAVKKTEFHPGSCRKGEESSACRPQISIMISEEIGCSCFPDTLFGYVWKMSWICILEESGQKWEKPERTERMQVLGDMSFVSLQNQISAHEKPILA